MSHVADAMVPFATGEAKPQPAESARNLLTRVEELAARLEHGAGTLVGKRVAVVSPDPDDVLAARLLLAFGATPTFLGPSQEVADHAEVVNCLAFLLRDQRKSLDVVSFTAADAAGIPVQPWSTTTTHAEPFDLVLVLGALPTAPAEARATLTALGQLVKVGGDLELFDSPRNPLPEATTRSVQDESGQLSLGVRRAERSPWHLSLVRLAEPLAEYPVEESSNGVILAHCLSRLHFAREFVAGRDVLEAGCATGIGARLFAAAGARRVLGLELHADLLDRAQLLTADSRIEYQQANLDDPLPCGDESFDVVICTEVLEHITNHEGAIREFLRVLRPGGRLIISVPCKDCEDGWAEVNRHRNPYHLRVPTAEELDHLLTPFASVRHYRQLDVVGSIVIADDNLRPAGEFSTPVQQLPSEVRAVRIAVCTKSPIAENAAPAPSLLLHRAFSDYQLGAHQHSRYLHNDLLALRHTAWAEQNRQRNEFEDQRKQFEARRNESEERWNNPAGQAWRFSFGPLVLDRPPEPGPWLTAVAEHVSALEGPPAVEWLGFPPLHIRVTSDRAPQVVQSPTETASFPIHTVMFPFPETHLPFGTVWRWHRRGARSFWFFEGDRWRIVDADAAVVRRLYRKGPGRVLRLLGRFLPVNANRWERALVRRVVARRGRSSCAERILGIDGAVDARLWTNWIARDNERDSASARIPAGRPLRVLQYVGGLYSGGAERQLCNLAIGLAERGVEVAVRTTYDPTEERGHYTPLLARHGLEVRRAGLVGHANLLSSDATDLLGGLPSHLADQVRELCAELLHYRPDVLHCWLDSPNIVGALAGLLAGVPRILLSMRNSNPTNFPRFYQPYMKEWYPRVLASTRVHVLSNSRSGAESYAEWLDIPYDRFHLVANGMHFGHFPESTPEHRRAAREAFGLAPDDRVVCGVFRLDEEKHPEVFLRVVEEVERRVPRLRVLLAGAGALSARVEEIVRERGLGRFLTLLGRREQVGEVLLASDAMLLTSKVEGCPNAVLEAQYMGVPVVATRGGGTADSVLHGETGYLADVGDEPELARHLVAVLSDEPHRAGLSRHAKQFVREEFTLDRMVDLTLLAYHRMHEPAPVRRVISPVIARVSAEESVPMLPAASVVASFAQRSITPQAILTPPPDAETDHPELSEEETRLVESVEGHFHLWDAQGVHRLARLSRGPVVELGSYLGKSTLALLLGAAKSKQRVYAVDPWFQSNPDVLGYEHTRLFGTDDYLGFCAHVRGHRDRLTVVASRGRDVGWQGPPIDALFIDAIHTYEEVRADFHHYLPHLTARARVAFHDFLPERTAFPGVRRFIEEELLTTGEWRWDDFRGALLTVERVRRSRKVIEHNRRCLEAARERIQAIARQFAEIRQAG